MPALTDLDIQGSIPHDSRGLFTCPTVDLPCLRELRILSDVDALTITLRQISFPQSAVLNLTCEETQHTQIDFSNFLSVLAEKFLLFLVIRSGLLERSQIWSICNRFFFIILDQSLLSWNWSWHGHICTIVFINIWGWWIPPWVPWVYLVSLN